MLIEIGFNFSMRQFVSSICLLDVANVTLAHCRWLIADAVYQSESFDCAEIDWKSDAIERMSADSMPAGTNIAASSQSYKLKSWS